MKAEDNIAVPNAAVASFCQKHHVQRLAFCGSVLRDDFSPTSDVDALVEFEPGHTAGLDFLTMEAELSAILRHRVHLSTRGWLSPYFREQALAEAQAQYIAP